MEADAATHYYQALETLINNKDDSVQKLYAVAAYVGQGESIDWCEMRS